MLSSQDWSHYSTLQAKPSASPGGVDRMRCFWAGDIYAVIGQYGPMVQEASKLLHSALGRGVGLRVRGFPDSSLISAFYVRPAFQSTKHSRHVCIDPSEPKDGSHPCPGVPQQSHHKSDRI